jgi:ribosome-associated protein
MTTTAEPVRSAMEAAAEKKAVDLKVLDVREISSFTDYFLICSGTSSRHIQSISDEIDRRMRLAGLRALHIEGYNHAEWVLMDYGEFVVHIFSERCRTFYDLERLWRTARRIPAQGIG